MSNWLAQGSFCLAAIAGAAFAQNSGHAGTEEDEIVEAIPARYNEESTLVEEIKPGENVIDFDLDSS